MKDSVEIGDEVSAAFASEPAVTLEQHNWTITGPWHFDEDDRLAQSRVDFAGIPLNFDHRIRLEGRTYVIHPEDIKAVRTLIADTQSGKSVDYHFRVVDGTGVIHVLHGFGQTKATVHMNNSLADTSLKTSQLARITVERDLLQKCLDGMPHLVWLADSQGNFLLFNDRWHAYTGLNYESSSGYQYIKSGLIHPSQLREATTKWEYSKKFGVPYTNETLLRNSDGDYFWHLDSILPLRNAQDEIEYWVGTLIDVNDEFMAEKKVHENNHLLEAIFNSSLNGIQVLESIRDENTNKIVDFEWKYFNAIARDIFGVDLNQQILSDVYEEARSNGLIDAFREVTLKGEAAQFEHHLVRGETEKWLEVSAVKLEDGVVATFHDITARKNAELEANESRHFIQQIANSTPDIIYVIDLRETKVVYVNNKVREYLGVEPEELYSYGPSIFERLLHPGDVQTRAEQLQGLLHVDDHDTRQVEVRLKSATGQWRWYKMRDTVFKRSPDGSVWQIVGLAQDIHDLKHAQERINVQHSVDRQAEKIAQIGNWQWNMTTGEVVWGENLYRLLGIEPGNASPSIKTFIDAIHPDDRDFFLQETQKLREATPGPLNLFYFRVRQPDGTIRNLRAATELLSIGGELRVIGTVRDVTRELVNEREIRERISFIETLVESSTYCIAVVDKQFRYLVWNKQCEQVYNLKQAQVLGKTIREIYPGNEGSAWMDRVAKALGGEFLHLPEEQVSEGDQYFEAFLIPLKDDTGEIYAALSVRQDITERVNSKRELQLLNESLRQKNVELSMMNEQLSTFAFVASHDLREPLRKIQVFSNSILDSELPRFSPRGKEYFDRILASIGRMNSMIEDILHFSRIHANPTTTERVDLRELAGTVVTDLKGAIRDTNAEVTIGDLPVYCGNRSQLRQLLQHLIDNALKFQPKGNAPLVQVTGQILEGADIPTSGAKTDRQYVKLVVTDNGIGIQQEYFGKVFQMFQRLHGVSQYPGTGMGLAICKKIVENHDGFIELSSEPGKGSVFTCYLCVP